MNPTRQNPTNSENDPPSASAPRTTKHRNRGPHGPNDPLTAQQLACTPSHLIRSLDTRR
ncbi:hypothetical protein PAXINDRAFT_22226 [Paxillus involutus ATCC 200175]|uniref:Uncharacterized protein n=1 Tax=Paxillus involutus ATCC 200175 TaxID=664439 RepID=A0A0C9TB34_PAXIN|nr:hypothetical protein PAXINDRAFT_22226 [Paxillus involutus ATCC 200175]